MQYFFTKHKNITLEILETISNIKQHILLQQYDEDIYPLNELYNKFENIRQIAIESHNEYLANCSYIVKNYVVLLYGFKKYLNLLQQKEYENSWMLLQDCLSTAEEIRRHLLPHNQYDVPNILELLLRFEKLYPYKVFASSEMGVLESVCNICGESMLGFSCSHIKGNL